MERIELPEKQGLYNPEMEKDNCGVGFIASIKGEKSYDILKKGLQILKSLKHRGAVGADSSTGDGSGIMLQIPHVFLQEEVSKLGINLPEEGDYAVGMIFLPRHPNARMFCEGVVERIIREEGQKLLGWRELPINEEACGESAKATRPVVAQVFIDRRGQKEEVFERKLLIMRKRAQKEIAASKKAYTDSFYICSLSTKTVIYKGQIMGYKLEEFYVDLLDERVVTSIALVHERYSTNTFPSWKLSQPFRYIAHNGEINTITGNKHWMNAREGVMHSEVFGEDFKKILPIIEPGGSDSASLDNVLELFEKNGHTLENSLMMLIPEAWQKDFNMSAEKRSYYEYHARVMEPWDGPATIAFSDGVKVGVTVDRNGLRPARYIITKDGLVVMASEIGVVEVAQENIIEKGCVEPGKILLINTKEGRIVSDEEIKTAAITRKPFDKWVKENRKKLKDIPQTYEAKKMDYHTLNRNHVIFGYTEEELKKVIAFMAENGKEPIGSMGIDTPLAILSQNTQILFNYFKQKFAQVTNPSIDPIREDRVMSLIQFIGNHGKLLDKIETEVNSSYIKLKEPILTNQQLENIRSLNTKDFRSITIPTVFQADHVDNGLKEALDYLCRRAEENVKLGYNILILSDRNIDMYNAPVPSLLALGAVHHHLVRKKLRTAVDIVIETGDARDVMHIALLVGFGAKAVNPYMAFETISYMAENHKLSLGTESAWENYIEALCSGLLKIISRMGISTLQSYCGAQIFEAVGINQEVIDEYFTNTPYVLSGLNLEGIAREVLERQTSAYRSLGKLETGGEILWNKDGEYHSLSPKVAEKLRKASVENNKDLYEEFSKEVNEQGESAATIRSQLKLKTGRSIPIEEVEDVQSILKRFRISGMSFGSISIEAHKNLATAANRIGAASNSGEGGEDPERYSLTPEGYKLRSEVKQVASGRFGVTANYLVNCSEIEIKVAQGAKPGEGGHLPGNKVTEEIAKVRHSEPGIDLISPPPHHDIYSIEDLAQLIFDLKNVNPEARVGVKLVSQTGIGTVAAGVAKAHADAVLVSGHDGGTGASPISSMKYVGLPWEIGLAEVQQTLLLNNLRSRIRLQVDGKMKTGRDVVIAAILGAEEYGFAASVLIASGCRMCRMCHLNKCSVGIATQDLDLREKFKGKPEHVINYLTLVAEEVRHILSKLGYKSLDKIVGRVDLLEQKESHKEKIKHLDLSSILYRPELPSRIAGKCLIKQQHEIDSVLDRKLIEDAGKSLEKGQPTEHFYEIRNTDRSFGTMLSGEIAKLYGDAGLPEDSIKVNLEGSAGQSFGAFAARGLTLSLQGDANDYLGKGLCGGKIIVAPPKASSFDSDKNIIAGNTLLYGATSGEAYISGRVGQRFCIRNSGATAVVEGVGNHGCEYMTGGIVVVLGSIGKNFGAGMSGGIAYIFDEDGNSKDNCNTEMIQAVKLENPKDIDCVRELIKRHYEYTGSLKAKMILDRWEFYSGKFLKVCSPAYQKQLEQAV
jgi:glutamate synthase (NADPH/NADH) large chain